MAKIAAYKFVNPGVAATASPEVKAARNQLLATNRVGSTVEGIGNIFVSLNEANKALLGLQRNQQRQRVKELRRKRDFEAEARQENANNKLKSQRDIQAKDKGKDLDVDDSAGNGFVSWFEKTLGPIANIFKDIATIFIAKGVTEWLSNPENREKLKTFLEKAGYVFGVLKNFVEDRVNDVLDGFKDLTDPNNSWWDRLKGLGKLMLGIIGLKYLMNPFSLITDIAGLINAITSIGDKPDVDGSQKPKKPKKPKDPKPKPTPKPTKPNLVQRLWNRTTEGTKGLLQKGKDSIGAIGNWWSKNSKAFIEGAKGIGKGVWDFGKNTAKQIGNLAQLAKDPAKLKDVVSKKLKDTLKPVLEKDETIKKVFEIVKNPKALGGKLVDSVKNIIKSPATKKGLNFLKEARKNVKIGGLDTVIAALFALLDYGVFGESAINALVTALGSLIGYSAGFAIGAPFGGLPGFITGAVGGVAGEFVAGKLLEGLAKAFPGLTGVEDPVAKALFPDQPSRPLLRDPSKPIEYSEDQQKELDKRLPKLDPIEPKAAGGLLKGTPNTRVGRPSPSILNPTTVGNMFSANRGQAPVGGVSPSTINSTNIGGVSPATAGHSPSKKQVAPKITGSPKSSIGNYKFSMQYAIMKGDEEVTRIPIPILMATPVPVAYAINTSQEVIFSRPSPLLDK